jgi:hypothetical protein
MFDFLRRNRNVSEKSTAQTTQPTIQVDPAVVLAELKQWHMDRIPSQRERYEKLYRLWQSGKVDGLAVQNAYSQWSKNVWLAAKFDMQLKAQQTVPAHQQMSLF